MPSRLAAADRVQRKTMRSVGRLAGVLFFICASIGLAQPDRLTVSAQGRPLTMTYLRFNTEAVRLQVRKAMAYAIDRTRLFSPAPPGFIPATGIQPPGMFAHNPNLGGYPYDREKAAELMRSIPRPMQLDLMLIPTFGRDILARSIAGQLRGFGVEVSITQVESVDRLLEQVEMGKFPLFILTIVPRSERSMLVETLLSPDASQARFRYRNDRLQQLFTQVRTESDPGRQVELYQEAERIALEDLPLLPLYYFPPAQ